MDARLTDLLTKWQASALARINGPGRWKTMRLHPHEFIRRFLMHVLPKGFHRNRPYGLFANTNRAENIATFLDVDPQPPTPNSTRIPHRMRHACPAHARTAARPV